MSSKKSLLGKVPPRVLKKFVFSNLGVKNRKVLLGPAFGLDNAVVSLDGVRIVVSSDPITGAKENLGRIGVMISTNDVALAGANPEFLTIVLILPPGTKEREIGRIMAQANQEALRLGVSIIGGHTEFSSIVGNPVFIGTSIGSTKRKRLVTSSGAKAGDDMVMVGEAGVEGTSILASDLGSELFRKGISSLVLIGARGLIDRLSIVKPALIAAEHASAMHDPTEGGVLGGIYEICVASRKGCIVDLSSIPIRSETRLICGKLGLDPLKLISSGTLLVTIGPKNSPRLLRALKRSGFRATVIGKITKDEKRRIGFADKKKIRIDSLPQDEIWRALSH